VRRLIPEIKEKVKYFEHTNFEKAIKASIFVESQINRDQLSPVNNFTHKHAKNSNSIQSNSDATGSAFDRKLKFNLTYSKKA